MTIEALAYAAAPYYGKEVYMARKRDNLTFEPMYKYNPAEAKPAKRKRLWRTLLRVLTLGLAG